MFKLAMVIAPKMAKFEAVVKEPLENSIRLLHEIGYDGVELSIIDPNEIDIQHVKSLIRNYGMEIPALSTGLNYLHHGLSLSSPDRGVREKAISRLKEIIDFASIFNAGVIIGLMRGRTERGITHKEAYRLMIESLNEVCSYAELKSVKIFFEPLNRYETDLINTIDEGLELIYTLNKNNLFLLLDTFHMNIEEAVIEESIAKARNKIGHFHIADSNRLAPGMGHINFKDILNTLKEVGYKGYLSAEIIIKPNFEKSAKVTYSTLKKIMEEIK